MQISDILPRVRLALRITTTAFDAELTDLIEAGLLDLGVAGITGENATSVDKLTLRAVITYCKMHFGAPEEFDRLSKSYDAQKGQLWSATGYTTWPEEVS